MTPIGWAASCNPHPSLFASLTLAHSERKNFPPTPKPDTVTSTFCPLIKLAEGVTLTFGLCAARAATKLVEELDPELCWFEAFGSAAVLLPHAPTSTPSSDIGIIVFKLFSIYEFAFNCQMALKIACLLLDVGVSSAAF